MRKKAVRHAILGKADVFASRVVWFGVFVMKRRRGDGRGRGGRGRGRGRGKGRGREEREEKDL